MNNEPQSTTGKLGRDSARRLLVVAGTLLAIALILFAAIRLLRPAPSPEAAAEEKPSRLEPVEETGLNRVLLTERAAERLGIQTAALREESVERKLIVGGEVVALPEAGGADAGKVWVRLFLTESDLNAVDRVQIAHILSLDDEEDSDEDDELMAEADEGPLDDDEDEAETLYYLVDNAGGRLVAGQRVFVELFLSGSGSVRKFIPYAAVIYDLEGETWVYTNPEPLVFVRHLVGIDYIEGEMAVLSDGPAVGTLVVTVGVAELYGADTGVGK